MTTFISFISGGSTMKFAILILAATTLSAQTPAQQTKKAAPPRDGIPASHGDDTRGYNDTPQLPNQKWKVHDLSLIHISEPTRLGMISYAVFCLKKKKPITK